jgi:hypothetical protein
MLHNHGTRLYTALLIGAALAVTLVAALTAWAAHLGDAAWLAVLVPFAVVLAAPMAALAWLRRTDGTDEPARVADHRHGRMITTSPAGRCGRPATSGPTARGPRFTQARPRGPRRASHGTRRWLLGRCGTRPGERDVVQLPHPEVLTP